jgi:hypothetical protein
VSDQALEEMGYVETFSAPQDQPPGGKRKFYGKYRGTVLQNYDPQRRGRLWVQVTDVFGLFVSNWAMPCLPMAGLQMGFYVIPPIGAGVWVEFEGGNPNKPIWVGCWWGTAPEPPVTAQATAPGVPVTLIEAMVSKSALIISDVPVPPMPGPGILLRSGTSFIHIGPTGITMTAPKVTVLGACDFNLGALTIT